MQFNDLESVTRECQSIVNLMARIIDVPVGLIMKVHDEKMEVFVSSDTKRNPYEAGNSSIIDNSGLFCERVIKTDKSLKIPNALKDINSKKDFEIKYNMIAYLGYPIYYPNKEIFGTICVLDNKENHFNKEYEELIEKFRDFIEGILLLLSQKNELEVLSQIDSLTKTLNRRTFFSKVEDELQRAKRYDRSLSLILLDIDFFKEINDTYGHQAGDYILEQVASNLKDSLRPTDHLGRYGGEEFFICLPETNYDAAKIFAQRILDKVSQVSVTYNSKTLSLTMSAGVVEYKKEENLNTVIKRVDDLMYQAKKQGRNCLC